MKTIFAALMMLVASNTYAQNTGGDFYVIPVIKNVEVCNGSPVGSKSFRLDSSASLRIGSVFSTTEGYLVQITGLKLDYWSSVPSYQHASYNQGEYFRRAPSTLPQPDKGVKAPYYYISYGDIAYAKYL